VVVGVGQHRVVLTVSDDGALEVCIRQAAQTRVPSRVLLLDVRHHALGRVDISGIIDSVLPALLRGPNEAALRAIARAKGIAPDEIGSLVCERQGLPVVISDVLADEAGHAIVQATKELVDLLPTYRPETETAYTGSSHSFVSYFWQSTIRVYHLVHALRRYGIGPGSSILEVGSRFGNFAYPLARLGYRVTSIDRYKVFGEALSRFKGLLAASGVAVVETDREDEQAVLAGLGRFDAVISMAVIEHIPHTPREFLRALISHVRLGGVLAMDTPNITRYWNRKRFAVGKSIHQDDSL
jgi:protein-L-isoaspartate O-methyltransferase